MTYKEFYGTQAWKNIRDAYIRSQGGLCERCFALGKIVPAKIVHHKIYMDDARVNNPELALNFENLEALCWACHEQEHQRGNFGEKKIRRYAVDALGRVIIAPR